jgi:hypothetical protein
LRTVFLSVIFLFPTIQPVTVENMNCNPPIYHFLTARCSCGACWRGMGLFAFIWWWAGARKYCTLIPPSL